MASPIDSLQAQIGAGLASTFHSASLRRSVAGTGSDPADPPAPTVTTYTCRALIVDYSKMLKASGFVDDTMRNVLILGKSLLTDPIVNDVVTLLEGPFTGQSFAILTIDSDAAKAAWDCKGRPS